ncbi:MAG: hypothetical protein ACYDB9_03440 [Gammaproteobacteria bacterium]
MNSLTLLQKHDAIREYLANKFPGSFIREHDDFDHVAQSFKIEVDGGSLLLKIAIEFIDDHNIEEILRRFDECKLCDLLRNEQRLGVMFTENGPSNFERN